MNDVVLLNQVREDGMRMIRVRHEGRLRLGRYVPACLFALTSYPSGAVHHLPNVSLREFSENGSKVTEIEYPVINAMRVKVGNGWRELFMVHRVWGTGLRDCIRLGVDAWMTAVKRTPGSAFVRRLPEGVESGTPIPVPSPIWEDRQNGGRELELLVFEADWMPEKVVAVGL